MKERWISCDRCGVREEEKPLSKWGVKLHLPAVQGGGSEKFKDFCPACQKEIYKFIFKVDAPERSAKVPKPTVFKEGL